MRSDEYQRENLLNSLNLPFAEQMYARYLADPASVPPDWRSYFERLSRTDDADLSSPPLATLETAPLNGAAQIRGEPAALQNRLDLLIRNYRVRGHLAAEIDPLGRRHGDLPELDPKYHGFTEADMDRLFSSESLAGDKPLALRGIVAKLRNTYCRSIGVQFMHIDDLTVRKWLQERMEGSENRLKLSRDEQVRILTRLTDAVIFEEFIRKKFIGAKTFSLEGGESLIPLLDLAIEKSGDEGLDEIVLAMAHRGRLNVLANIVGKSPREIFREFEDSDAQLHLGHGDVKYHLGYSNDWHTASGRKVHLSLCFNPSHLEFVNPVAMGRLRAKQDRVGDLERSRGMALLIHGDAAFAGEGVIQETLNLSQLHAYGVGGMLHIIVNNQIGFTTCPNEYRSTEYTSDVAKMLQIPIFHVNGEDPEAVAQVVRLSMDFRRTFKRDVVIDMYCYRRLGHNETDEPAFTQPVLYRTIARRKSVREGYLEHLLKLGGVTPEEADAIAARRREQLERELSEAQSETKSPRPQNIKPVWAGYYGGPASEADTVETGVPQERLSELLEAQTRIPEGFHLHPKIERGLRLRHEMAESRRPLDWAAAEALAFASVATQGVRVRLTGQDSARGTFSQRHAALHDTQDGRIYVPLQHLSPAQAAVEIYNSPLSEVGVLGFEYGYSLDYPDALVLWEAQFGDFVNAGQVIIDQFISSAERKWRRLSGIVLLLPHGFEGMGPEHSSARLERFLQLAAKDNLQVVSPTTPAQYFHCLRRQAFRRWRKPLVIMTPKSLLRHPTVTSTLEECARGSFQPLLSDAHDGRVTRVLLCSGKVYYDLAQKRARDTREDVAVIRLEQLYPLPDDALRSELAAFRDDTPVFWVQEEPANMGAWHYLRVRFGHRLFDRFPLSVISRTESASPATGSPNSHKREQEALLAAALGN
jgi:2-oxoglutarate dehydrogenase E1 component